MRHLDKRFLIRDRVMTIALDCRAATSRTGGVGRYIINLAQGMSAELGVRLLLLVGHDYHPSLGTLANTQIVPVNWTSQSTPYSSRLRWEQIELARVLRRLKPDIFHATWNYGIPCISHCPSVLTLHDLIPLEESRYFGSRSDQLVFRASQYSSLLLARKVIAVSSATKAAISKFAYPFVRKTTVILQGVEKSFAPELIETEPEYLLYVGGRERRKNIGGIFKAYELAVNKWNIGLPLKLTGTRESLGAEDASVLVKLAASVQERISFTGFVPDGEMPNLYRKASALIFPSKAEGFGFPPLEAIACGTPVIASRSGSIPEVLGDAAIFVDSDDLDSIADGIRTIALDLALRSRLSKAGLARAAVLRWPNCVAKTLAVYRGVLGL